MLRAPSQFWQQSRRDGDRVGGYLIPRYKVATDDTEETNGALGRTRTPGPLIRSQVLYPAELPAPKFRCPFVCNEETGQVIDGEIALQNIVEQPEAAVRIADTD